MFALAAQLFLLGLPQKFLFAEKYSKEIELFAQRQEMAFQSAAQFIAGRVLRTLQFLLVLA